LGIYATVLSAGFAIGPLLIRVTGIEGMTPFLVSAGIVALAAVPILIARADAPRFGNGRSLPVSGFLRVAPVAILAALVFGATETCILSLLPSYGFKNGLGIEAAATLLAVTGAGSIALQIPIGWLSDRFDRLHVLLFCALVGLGGIALLPALIGEQTFLWPLLFVWGGVIVGLYTVGLVLLGERVDDADLAAANAAFIQAYGFGAIMGPALAGAAMSGVGPDGLPLTLGLLFGGYLVFGLVKAST
jgi:cyanate permease